MAKSRKQAVENLIRRAAEEDEMMLDNGDPMESIIARALFTGNTDRGKRQANCNMEARTKMFCGCGSVLDQRTVQILEIHDADGSEQTIAAMCPKCRTKNNESVKAMADKYRGSVETKVVWVNWHLKEIL